MNSNISRACGNCGKSQKQAHRVILGLFCCFWGVEKTCAILQRTEENSPRFAFWNVFLIVCVFPVLLLPVVGGKLLWKSGRFAKKITLFSRFSTIPHF